MRGENVKEHLVRVIEDDLIVLPGVHGTGFGGCLERGDLRLAAASSSPGVQLEVVVEGDSLLARLGNEVYSDSNLELAPSDITPQQKKYCKRVCKRTLFLIFRRGACRHLQERA